MPHVFSKLTLAALALSSGVTALGGKKKHSRARRMGAGALGFLAAAKGTTDPNLQAKWAANQGEMERLLKDEKAMILRFEQFLDEKYGFAKWAENMEPGSYASKLVCKDNVAHAHQ
jgi:hypothetical protein